MPNIRKLAIVVSALTLVSCGGGSRITDAGADPAASERCDGSCVTANSFLSADDVRQIVAQGVQEARARNSAAVIAVVDRVGNVLAVYRSTNAANTVTVTGGGSGGLEGVGVITPELAAIAKAITGAYLSSEGNAFSTRTASQIVQDHFNPGELHQPAGPLFGVQFSQLACSDFTSVNAENSVRTGPMRSPLGLSADPGGFPLYKGGTVVGGVGVMVGGAGQSPTYGLDGDITDLDRDLDELVAVAATYGYAAPMSRRADRITAGGKTFRFSDVDSSDLASDPTSASPTLLATSGGMATVPFYFNGIERAGTAFGQTASGIRADNTDYPGLDAFVFDNGAGNNRFPPTASGGLSENDVRDLMRSALAVANKSRAQIRAPLGSQARVTISVVDPNGVVLAMARTRDAPVFGADVSLQKARTAAFFSSPNAATLLGAVPAARYLAPGAVIAAGSDSTIGAYVTRANVLFQDTTWGTGTYAITSRAAGNIALPYFPDGLDDRGAGPFSKPAGQWSPFNIGLQLDVSYNGIITHVARVLGVGVGEIEKRCFGAASPLGGDPAVNNNAILANGLQMFPGGVPIFKGSTLVGAIGVSGDGVDQDDMIAFLGVANAGNGITNAPAAIRSDTLTPQGVRLRYVQCPQAPFINSSVQNVCAGK